VAKGNRNRQQARAKIAQMRALEARRRRRRRWLAVAGAVVVAAGAAVGIVLAVTGGSSGTLRAASSPGPLGPEGVPVPTAGVLASPSPATSGQAIDGISCQTSEQTLFHIHAHLTIFVNGAPRQVPAAIGIPRAQVQSTARGPVIASGTCFYWLHTHAADGVVHIESPVTRTYTLGNFFDEWGQPLGPDQVGPAQGHVTVLYNGQVYRGNPRNVPLTAHAQIQLGVGTPLVAPVSITWPSGL
jgi:hypothetical protein